MATSPKPKRKAFTKALERKLFIEAQSKCPWCNVPLKQGEAEIHHIDGDRSNNVLENLILACRNHHGQIGSGLIPEWEVHLKKQILCNPGVMERLGLAPKLPAPTVTSAPIVGRDNHGIAGQQVNVGTVKIQRPKGSKSAPIAGLIEANPDMRTHAIYLVRQYIDWRKKGAGRDKRPFNPGSAHGILAEGFGSPTSVLQIPEARFHAWMKQAEKKIDGTVFGKTNTKKGIRNYHTWEEHLKQRHG